MSDATPPTSHRSASFHVGSLMKSKLGPVPIIYIGAGIAVILAVYAWRTKSTAIAVVGDTSAAGTGNSRDVTGTLIPTTATTVATPVTNDDWERFGVSLLVSKGYSATDAQRALDLYLSGADLSHTQSDMVNAVLTAYGTPPSTPSIGSPNSKFPTFATNADWERAAIDYIMSLGGGAAVTQRTLDLYLDSQDLTYEQSTTINTVIAKLGFPPEPRPIGQVQPEYVPPETVDQTAYVSTIWTGDGNPVLPPVTRTGPIIDPLPRRILSGS